MDAVNFVRRGRKLLYPLFVLGIVALFVVIGMANPFFVQSVRLLTFDSMQKLAPRAYDERQPVRVVDIDDKSLEVLGQWPWPRTVMAELIGKIGAAGAASITTDIIYAEPDRTSLGRYTKNLPADKADEVAKLVGGPLDNDAVFADTISKLPVVLGTVLIDDGSPKVPTQKSGFAVAGDDPRPFLHGFTGVLPNLPALDTAASGIGATNWIPDHDGIIRRVPLMFRAGDKYVPSLAAEALRVAQGAGSFVLKASNASGETAYGAKTGLNHIKIGAIEAPTDADGGIWPRFRHFDARSYIPAWKVMSGDIAPDALNGDLVLLGISAPGLKDVRATPLDSTVPGVELHVQMLEQLLTGVRLTRPDYAPPLELVFTIVASLLIAVLLPRVRASYSSALAVVIVAGIFGYAWYAFTKQSLLFDPVNPSLAVTVMFFACTAWTYRQTQNQKGEIRKAFGQYLSPDVVQQLIANPEKLALGGEERPLTIMFCDVRNFTSLSESLDAQGLTHFINTLLTPLTGAILERRGTVDKYMGDAIMAFWNAPLPLDGHARNAVEAAIAMANSMPDFNVRWKAEMEAAGRVYKEVKIGIGLNTGVACVGNLGSDQRFDYSVIGDEVNIASRFEGLTKQYGMTLAIGERTAEEVSGSGLGTLEIDLVRVKGRVTPSRLFTLTETLNVPEGRTPELMEMHAAFITAYRSQQWDEAIALKVKLTAIGVPGLEKLYEIYTHRIEDYLANPPGADWDGAYTATEK
ncbi:MAG: adenylate cyclase [Rhodospirillales bacterium]|nr:adenylate cyclase [Rhodospirillales bacterium]